MAKRIVASFFAVVFMIVFCSVSFAEGYQFTMDVKSDTYSASKGDTVTVTCYINSITHPDGILGHDAEIEYDPSHLKLEGVEGIFPSNWDKAEIYPVEKSEGNKNVVSVTIIYDGTNMDTVAVKTDDTLGYTLKFSVVTASKTNTTVKIPEGDTLSSASGTPSVSSLVGLGDSYTFSLNDTTSDTSTEESSEGPFYSMDGTESYEEITSNVLETTESEPEDVPSAESSGHISSDSNVETPSDVEDTEKEDESFDSSLGDASADDTSSVISGESDSSALSDESSIAASNSSEAEEEGGFGFITWIVVGCIAVAVIAFVVYWKNNKKEDTNPVNPG